jgi:S-adenosylmethionine decarboxylase
MSKIPLYGFNNLTKSLSFSLYKLHYITDRQAQRNYNDYINQRFCADNLNTLLVKICHAIGGNVLNTAKQNYQPQGASVTLMISEEARPESLVAHIDKSHICIHTYPEEVPQDGIAIFRADIELSTCGVISPLKVLSYVIEKFNADVVDIDYRVRGMTRDKQGKKTFIDEKLQNITDHLSTSLLTNFHSVNHNLPTQGLFHSKLGIKEIRLERYFFDCKESDLTTLETSEVRDQIQREIKQLFTGTN